MTETASKYALLGRLATGGMAELYLARAKAGAPVVVLKRIKPRRLSDPKFVSMFLDEARLAAQLDHDNIARVHDIGKLGESYFFTMEYIHGEDIRTVLGRLAALKRPLPVSVALYVARAVAAGLHYAHEKTGADGTPLGIVHRDVSPSNIMAGFDGTVKLVDFGVAKAAQHTVKTEAGMVKGKVTYFSPEQCKGRQIDRQTDVFSLGIVLHEMLTGRRLYRRPTDYQVMRAILAEPVAPPSEARAGLHAAIDAVTLTALAKEPADRFATAGAFNDAIGAAAAAAGVELATAPAALRRVMADLFGARPLPWLELAARDDAGSVVTVTSVLADASHPLAIGSGLTEAELETEVETALAKLTALRDQAVAEADGDDTDVSTPSGDWSANDPDDEWRDEPVARGGMREDIAPVDPATALAEVEAATRHRRRTDPTAVEVPEAPAPDASGSLAVGDKRVSIELAAVQRRRLGVIVAAVVAFVVGAVAAIFALS